jgi:hypothetical protein
MVKENASSTDDTINGASTSRISDTIMVKENASSTDGTINETSPSQSSQSGTGTGNGRDKRGPRMGLFRRLRGRRRHSAPPAPGRRRLLVEDHFRVTYTDTKYRVVLPGVPKHDDDWARDSHDFFNLVALLCLNLFNILNWNWDEIFSATRNTKIEELWTGEYFQLFFYVTLFYFVVDLLWVFVIPSCVKSPATILQHHVATLLYMLVPYYYEPARWCMGACMIVEINTWFLIARRVFNKQGFPPWIIDLSFVSIRVKLISIFFYVTWIAIRCILYPYLLWHFTLNWLDLSRKTGTKINPLLVAVPLQTCFCLLNLRWTYDLLMSKIRYWRRKGNWKEANKGL